MVGIGHQKLIDIIVLDGFHSLDPMASPMLALEIIKAHTLDIAELRHRDHGIRTRDQILIIDLRIIEANRGSSFIPVLIRNLRKLLPDNAEKLLFIGKNCLIFRNPFLQLRKFRFQLLSFQTGESTKPHLHNGAGLRFGQRKPLHEDFLGFLSRMTRPDQPDHLIDIIERNKQTFDNMRPLFRFIQIKPGSSGNNILLMLQIELEHFGKIQNLRLTVYKTKLDHTEGVLHLGMLKKLVQHHIRIYIPPQLDYHPGSLTVGFIP